MSDGNQKKKYEPSPDKALKEASKDDKEKEPSRKKGGRRKLVLIGVVAVLLIGLATGWLVFRGDFLKFSRDSKLEQVRGVLKQDAYNNERTALLAGWYLGCRNTIKKRRDKNYCNYGELSQFIPERIKGSCQTVDLFYNQFWNEITRTDSCKEEIVKNCSRYFSEREPGYENCKALCEHYLYGGKRACERLEVFEPAARYTCLFYIDPAGIDFCDNYDNPESCRVLVDAIEVIKNGSFEQCAKIGSTRERLICELYFKEDKKVCDQVYQKFKASLP